MRGANVERSRYIYIYIYILYTYVRKSTRDRTFLSAEASKALHCEVNYPMVFDCPLFKGNFVLKSAVRSRDCVRRPESRNVCFSEVV